MRQSLFCSFFCLFSYSFLCLYTLVSKKSFFFCCALNFLSIWLRMEIAFHSESHFKCHRINSSHSVLFYFILILFETRTAFVCLHVFAGTCLIAALNLWMSRVYSSGIEGNPTVFYRLMPGSTSQTNKFHTFYLQQRPDNGDTWADIKVNHPLDYETIKEYNLTIRVEVSAEISPIFLAVEIFNFSNHL